MSLPQHDVTDPAVGTSGPSPQQAVVLIDVENVIGGKTPRDEVIRARVTALLAPVPGTSAVAFFARHNTIDDERMSTTFRALGITPVLVERTRNAADHAILTHARTLATEGHRDFVVASADKALARIAELGVLRVLAWSNQPVSQQLRTTAADIIRVDRPDLPRATALPTDEPSAATTKSCAGRLWFLRCRRDLSRRARELLPPETPNPDWTVFVEGFADFRRSGAVALSYGLYWTGAQLIPPTVAPMTMLLLVSAGGAVCLGFVTWLARQYRATTERQVAVLLWKSLRECVRAQQRPTSASVHRTQRAVERAATVAERGLARGGSVLKTHEQAMATRIARHLRLVLLTDPERPLAEQLRTLETDLAPVTAAFLNQNWTAATSLDRTPPKPGWRDDVLNSRPQSALRRYLRHGATIAALGATVALSWSSSAAAPLWSLSGLAGLALAFLAASTVREPATTLSALLGRK